VRLVSETPEIPALRRVADAVVLPSLFEGFPNVLLEAMASGLPAVATAVGDVPSLIEEGVTGFLVPSGDAAALALALERLHALGPEARRAMGRAARAQVEARHQLEGVAARHLTLYESLLAASPQR
jgi:glycosyltransferase involved in cell wall biosynthesis